MNGEASKTPTEREDSSNAANYGVSRVGEPAPVKPIHRQIAIGAWIIADRALLSIRFSIG